MRARLILVLVLSFGAAACGGDSGGSGNDAFRSLRAGDCIRENQADGVRIPGGFRVIDCAEFNFSVTRVLSDGTDWRVEATGKPENVQGACDRTNFDQVIIDGDWAVCFTSQ